MVSAFCVGIHGNPSYDGIPIHKVRCQLPRSVDGEEGGGGRIQAHEPTHPKIKSLFLFRPFKFELLKNVIFLIRLKKKDRY